MTIDRKAKSISRKANSSTKPNTSGSAERICSPKSSDWAVCPVTPVSASGSAPTVAGTTSSRRVSSAALEASSVPLPSIGMATLAMVPSSLMSTSIGSCICPVATACACSSPMALCTSADRTSGASTTTIGRGLGAGEGGLNAVVGVDDLDGVGQALHARLGGAHLQRRERQRDQQAAGEHDRDDRVPEHAVDDGSPEPALAGLAPAAGERDAPGVDAAAEA